MLPILCLHCLLYEIIAMLEFEMRDVLLKCLCLFKHVKFVLCLYFRVTRFLSRAPKARSTCFCVRRTVLGSVVLSLIVVQRNRPVRAPRSLISSHRKWHHQRQLHCLAPPLCLWVQIRVSMND